MTQPDERVSELRQWAQTVDWLHVQMAVCLGYTDVPAWGPMREFRPDLRVVVFEPDRDIAAKAQPPEGCAVVSHLVDLREAINSLGKGTWRIETCGDPRLNEQWGAQVQAAVNEAARHLMSIEVTCRANVVDWTNAALDILPHMAGRPTLDRIPAIAEGRPGIIIGAGPSLADNLDALREMQGKAVLCAVSSALGTLATGDVQPDIVVSVEVRRSPLDKTFGLQSWKRAILCHGSHVSPAVYEAPARAIVPALQAVGPIGSWLCSYAGIRPFATGGSVSTLAYSILRHLGCDPVILVGVDCAFGDDDETMYAPGAIREDGEVFNHQVNERVAAWGGLGTVGTTWALSSYRHWFEMVARRNRGGHINANGRGALVAGWADVRLPDVAKRFGDVERRDFGAELEAAANAADVLDPAALAEGLKRELDDGDDYVRNALVAHTNCIALTNAVHNFAAYGERHARIMAGLCVAPVNDVVRFPDGDQHRALAHSFELANERAAAMRPKWEATIAALEELTHDRA